MKHAHFFTWVLLSATLVAASPVAAQQFGPWSAPVNLGPPVDTAENADFQPNISADGLSLYFVRLAGDGDPSTGMDIWAAHRPTRHAPWSQPVKLPDTINAPDFSEATPFLSVDGHRLYFASNQTTVDKNGVPPFGDNDIYVARRLNKREDLGPLGWQAPENLGSGVNTEYREGGPCVFEDEATGVTTLYFNSNRPGGLGGMDIYAATLQPDGTFGQAAPVADLNSADADVWPMISRDGLEMYFVSDRPGSNIGPDGVPWQDIWVSTRARTSDPWGPPQNLDAANASLGGGPINSSADDGKPTLSSGGKTMYFHSAFRAGGQSDYYDIWVTTRTKLKTKD